MKLVGNCWEYYRFFEILKEIYPEMYFRFKGNQLSIQSMDASRIMLAFMDKPLIRDYEAMDVGFNVEDMYKRLECRKSDKKLVNIEFTKEKIIVSKFPTNNLKGKIKIVKELFTLDDIENEVLPRSNLEAIQFDQVVTLERDVVYEMLKESGTYADITTMMVKNGHLLLKEKGQLGTSIITADTISHNGEAKDDKDNASFSIKLLEILKKACKYKGIVNKVYIYLKKNHPVKIKVTIGGTLNVKLLMFLAPRVEEVDDDDDDMDPF